MTVQSAALVVPVGSLAAAETVAGVLPFIGENVPAAGGVLIHGTVNVTIATTATSVTIKVRQGSTTAGTQVGLTDTENNLTAGGSYSIPFAQLFNPQPGLVPMPAGNQFCVTVTFPSGTAAGAINDGVIWMDAVSPGG
jgi:hypothetical protein